MNGESGGVDLLFTVFEVVAVGLAVLTISLVARDGETHWIGSFAAFLDFKLSEVFHGSAGMYGAVARFGRRSLYGEGSNCR